MARCEDFPCCGHGSDPGGCPDFSRQNTCEDCGRKFYPDALTSRYCYACGSTPRFKAPEGKAVAAGECDNCNEHAETRREWRKNESFCDDCFAEAVNEAQSDFEYLRDSGGFDE